MQTYRGFGVSAVPPASQTWTAGQGIPATADWIDGITGFATAISWYGTWKVIVPFDVNGNLFGVAWNKDWKLVPYDQIPMPTYPDHIVQGVTGTPFVSWKPGTPVPGGPVATTQSPQPPYPAPAGQQWYWDNASQSYKLATLATTVEVSGIADAKAHATDSLSDMLAEITTFQGSADAAARDAANALNFAGAIDNTLATVAGKLATIITSGAKALQDLRATLQAQWASDAKAGDAAIASGDTTQEAKALQTFTGDLTAGVQAFNSLLTNWQGQRDDAAKATLYGIQSAHPADVPSQVPPNEAGGGGGGAGPSVTLVPDGGAAVDGATTTTELAPGGVSQAGLPLLAGLAIAGAFLMRGKRR